MKSTILSILVCSCRLLQSDCIVSMAQDTVEGGVGSDKILVGEEMAFLRCIVIKAS